MKTPLVTIGMPVYNGDRYLAEAIDSILAQTFEDFELLICDNASTDETRSICACYVQRDPRVRYERNPRNMGAAYSYNRVVELARGKYFRHAAHDDLLAPRNLERCVEILEADPGIVLVYPQMSRIDERGNVLDTFARSLVLSQDDPVKRWTAFHRVVNEGSMCDPAFGLFRTDVLRATPVLRSVMGADMLMLADVALRGRIAEVPEVLFFERWHRGTSVNANPTLDDRAAWFDPAARGKLSNAVPHWQWLVAYLKMIGTVSLTPLQRTRCAVVILGPWAYSHKRGLVLGPLALAARALQLRGLAKRIDRALLRAPLAS